MEHIYQLSLYGKGTADFKVLVNGKEVEAFHMLNPEQRSISSLLPVQPGKNTVLIQIAPDTASQGDIVYAYDLFKFPKGSSSTSMLLEDKYKLFSSTPQGEIVGFLKIRPTGVVTVPFEIDA